MASPYPAAALLLLPIAACTCFAQQWTAVVLHPTWARYSEVLAVNAHSQGGWVLPTEPFADSQAGIWTGSAQSWTSFSPPNVGGQVQGMDATMQVGALYNGSGAWLWRGTPESGVNLHPPGAYLSGAVAVRNGMQTGGISFPGGLTSHAGYWRGTAESFIDLHPPGAVTSSAAATDGIVQGGMSRWPSSPGTRMFATLWHGSAESFVILGPPDRRSQLHAMAPGVQVGEVQSVGGYHAAVWQGTPETWADLHPPGQSGTTALYATTGRVHVGLLTSSGLARAAINFGTPNAWLDLHQFLPPEYTTFSRALAVHQDGNTVMVGGYAVNPATSDNEAILWIGTVPPEYCYANCDQSTSPPYLNIDDFTCFINQFASARALPFMEQLGHRANCDQSTIAPVLNVDDFTCFINTYARGCE